MDDRASGDGASTVTKPVTVALVNDYEIILRGLHAMLAPFDDRVTVIGQQVGGTPEDRADVALFDTFAGRRNSLDRAGRMVRDGFIDHVVLYTWDAPSAFIAAARQAGVSAVILKSVAGRALVEQIEDVVHGKALGFDLAGREEHVVSASTLSLREQEVLALLARGLSNPDIAGELFLSVDTVKTYVRRLFTKLGVNNRTSAALLAADYGLIPPTTRESSRSRNAESD